MKRLVSPLLLAAVLAVTGCALEQPKHELPALDLPAAWKESAPPYAEDGRWWRIYEDPQLEILVDEAIAHNADLQIAVARVDEARALAREADSFFYPAVSAQGIATKQQNSKSTATFFPGIPTRFTDYRATLNVSYEVDVFGRLPIETGRPTMRLRPTTVSFATTSTWRGSLTGAPPRRPCGRR